MALNFPSNPTANQVYTLGEKSWKWNGYGWKMQDITAGANLELSVFNTIADGSTSTFDLTFSPVSDSLVLVTIGGIVQPESIFSVNTVNSTILFTSPPPATENVRVVGYKTVVPYAIDAANSAGASVETFSTVGDNVTTTYNIGFNPVGANAIFVTVGGVVQPDSSYTVNPLADSITFDTPPGTGENIRVVGFSKVNPFFGYFRPANTAVRSYETTADGVTSTFNLGFEPKSNLALIVSVDGVFQAPSTYTINNAANTITFLSTPQNNEYIAVTTLTNAANVYVIEDGSITFSKLTSTVNNKISLALDRANASFITANASFIAANAAATTGKAIAMSIVFGG